MGRRDLIEVEARRGDGAAAADLEPLVAHVRAACARVGITRATVGLVVVSPHEMAAINGEHRPVDFDAPRTPPWRGDPGADG